MTTVVVQQAEPAYEPATTIGFGNVLRSEWTKLRSVRSTYWTLLMAVLTTVALGAVICARWAYVARHDGPGNLDGFDPTLTSLNGIYLAQIAVGALGVLVITSEYGTGMIRATFSAVPQRRSMLAAKGIVFGVAMLVLGEVMSFAAFGIGQALLSGAHAGASLGQPGVLRAVIGAGLYLSAAGLLGFGLGTMIRAHGRCAISVLRPAVRRECHRRSAADELAQRRHRLHAGQRGQPDLHDRPQPRLAEPVGRARRVLPLRRRRTRRGDDSRLDTRRVNRPACRYAVGPPGCSRCCAC